MLTARGTMLNGLLSPPNSEWVDLYVIQSISLPIKNPIDLNSSPASLGDDRLSHSEPE